MVRLGVGVGMGAGRQTLRTYGLSWETSFRSATPRDGSVTTRDVRPEVMDVSGRGWVWVHGQVSVGRWMWVWAGSELFG